MYNANQEEQKVLKYWEDNKTFEKSVSERPESNPYVFYDGPPFATGLPHYGHILSSVIKDVVPRYMTMKGYRVRRRWGWDCHGLPIENIVEKELKVSGKKDVEEKLGVDKFNETCRSKVLTYTQDWKKMINRIGRWVEFDNAYKTMDSTYMESVWWSLKTIWEKGLIYEGRKVLMYCPRCETPVSKAEIAMDDSYKDITEETVVVKFKLKEQGTRNKEQLKNVNGPVYILAWTTTPWTLPGNVALAVGNDIDYQILEFADDYDFLNSKKGDKIIIAKHDHIESELFGNGRIHIKKTDSTYRNANYFVNYKKNNIEKEVLFSSKVLVSSADLVGLEYEPLFDIPAIHETGKKAWYVTDADFVTTEEGTGVVHTAVVYGEDDYNLGLQRDLPVVPLLDDKGHFNDKAPEFIKGKYFKGAEKEIKADLESRGLLFSREQHTHSYPHCWRCDTQLFYNAISAWFIDIQKIKDKLIKLNEKINWYPDHLKHGRFLNILETAPDWNISRNRFWATPLPFWRCEGVRSKEKGVSCDNVVCVGSVAELKDKAVNFDEVYKTDKVEEIDLHKHLADKIKLKCEKCGGIMSRIPEVIDCWVESASMPFVEWHYPFENQETFKKRFPGQYIAEYIAQTRAWFYYMHVMAVLLFDDVSFENVVCTGTILNDKGEKLSKSKMNYTDPWKIIDEFGVDALRYYLMTSVVMQAENLYFNDREVRDVYNKVMNILDNVLSFYGMFNTENTEKMDYTESTNVLDKWILAKLNVLVGEVTEHMDKYDTVRAGRPIKDFIDELSTWYLQCSRDRFKDENETDKQFALSTLRQVLETLSKVMAPFTPFIAEKVWFTVTGSKESVHLQEWPEFSEKAKVESQKVLDEMDVVRKIIELILFARAEAKIKIRQPLSIVETENYTNLEPNSEMVKIIREKTNVKEVKFVEKFLVKSSNAWIIKENGELKIELNIEITPELKKEGLLREVVRTINQIRKEQKMTIEDRVVVEYSTDDELLKSVFMDFVDELKKSVLATELKVGESGNEVEIDGKKIKLKVS
ncbi:MAG TPA: isoleucine--tRNA ligase [Candidatus Magasanikbacteria bacterium]|nr:isoleucine--tRNA ligase [Candidatus Magasanikbacteria bacterium]